MGFDFVKTHPITTCKHTLLSVWSLGLCLCFSLWSNMNPDGAMLSHSQGREKGELNSSRKKKISLSLWKQALGEFKNKAACSQSIHCSSSQCGNCVFPVALRANSVRQYFNRTRHGGNLYFWGWCRERKLVLCPQPPATLLFETLSKRTLWALWWR